jgi:AraC-like DNA-binding protein
MSETGWAWSPRTEAEKQVTALTKAKDEALAAAPKTRDLEARIAALTAEAALRQRETTTLAEAKTEAEKSRDALAKQFDDYKGSTATALRERTTLQSSEKMLESDKASLRRQAETASSEAAQLRTQVASLKEQVSAKPAAPSWPGTNWTPGSDAAIAARSPSWSIGTFDAAIACSVPPMSGWTSPRCTRSRAARIFTGSSTPAIGNRRASATRISWSAVRFTSNRRGANPMWVKETM